MGQSPSLALGGSSDRLSLLLEASGALNESLNFFQAIQTAVNYAVPRLADICTLDVYDEQGGFEHCFVAATDTDVAPLIHQLRTRYPIKSDHSAFSQVRQGKSVLAKDLPLSHVQKVAQDKDHERLIRTIGIHSYLMVPVQVRGHVLGALSLGNRSSPNKLDEADLRFAEEFANRAALALDNARLFELEQRTSQTLAAVLDSSPLGVVVLDAEGRVHDWSRSAEAITGWKHAEAMGQIAPFITMIPQHHQALFWATLEHVLAGNVLNGVEEVFYKRGGKPYLARMWAAPVQSPAAGTRCLFLLEDATDDLHMQDQLRTYTGRVTRLQSVTAALAQATKMEQVFQVIGEMAFSAMGAHCGMVARLTENGEALNIVGDMGISPSFVGRQKQIPLSAPTPSAEAVRSGIPIWLDSPDSITGRYPVFMAQFAPLGIQALACLPLSLDGHVYGAMAWGFPEPRSFSEDDRMFFATMAHQCAQAIGRIMLFEKEQQARERAENASQLRQNLVAMVSHELKNPLSVVSLSAEFLLQQVARPRLNDDEVFQVIENVMRAGDRMKRIIASLLDIAQIDAGRLLVTPENTPARVLIREALREIRPLADAQGVSIDLQMEDPDLSLWCDRERTLQILLNLLGNAIKFTPPGGRITLTSKTDGEQVRITVTDTGPGIDAAHVPYLFEPFWRATHEPGKGNGLGLAIAKGLVEAQGGTISVETQLRQGSAFSISLPARQR